MSSFWLVVIVCVVAVALMALGLALTLIFKGHNIKSEIGENENMRRLGIKCTAQQMREEENAYYGREGCVAPDACGEGGCAACGVHEEAAGKM
jgi:hypothetical protein